MENTNIIITNGTILKANASCFIVPNSAGTVNRFFCKSVAKEMQETAEALCSLNGLTAFEPEVEKLVQIWSHSQDDLGSENLHDHGFNLWDAENNHWFGRVCEYFPAKIFDGHKEGETITLKVPVTMFCYDDHEARSCDITLEMNLTLDQRHYRYRHFGDFEEVLQQVCA